MTSILAQKEQKYAPTSSLTRLAIFACVGIALMVQGMAAQASSAPDSFADLAEELSPMVVNISTTMTVEGSPQGEMPQFPPGSPFEDFFKEFFDRQGQGQGNENGKQRKATSLGSGFIISKDGYVVTNNHVIADADEITVILRDDTRLEAELIGRDPKTDLALLKVTPAGKWPVAEFGDSDKSRVGDWVLAIGNPFGLGGSVTAGIISARGRDINAGPYDDFLQTDASINRGNSGGPMFNMDGEVIGINTAIYSPSGGSVGIGFAIPSNVAKVVINQLIEHGQVRRGWLGVHIQEVTEEIAETLGMDKAEGALVANVMEDGPAAAGGIQAGDVVLTFNGTDVSEMRRLPKIVADTPVDKKVDVLVWRDGKKKKLKIVVGKLDDEKIAAASSPSSKKSSDNMVIKELGLSVASLSDAVREKFELDDTVRGVLITAVDADGSAAEKGIRPGDLIVEVSQEEVSTPDELLQRMKEAQKAGRKSVLLLVESQAGLRFVALKINGE